MKSNRLLFEQAPENVLTLELKTPEGLKEYSLVLSYKAIIKAEEISGLNFALFANWQKLSAANLSILLWASMLRYHPEVTLDDVREWVPPAVYADTFSALLQLCHPEVMEAIKKSLEVRKEDSTPGELAPSQQ